MDLQLGTWKNTWPCIVAIYLQASQAQKALGVVCTLVLEVELWLVAFRVNQTPHPGCCTPGPDWCREGQSVVFSCSSCREGDSSVWWFRAATFAGLTLALELSPLGRKHRSGGKGMLVIFLLCWEEPRMGAWGKEKKLEGRGDQCCISEPPENDFLVTQCCLT